MVTATAGSRREAGAASLLGGASGRQVAGRVDTSAVLSAQKIDIAEALRRDLATSTSTIHSIPRP